MNNLAKAQTKQAKKEAFDRLKVGAPDILVGSLSDEEWKEYNDPRRAASQGDQRAEADMMDMIRNVQQDIAYRLGNLDTLDQYKKT